MPLVRQGAKPAQLKVIQAGKLLQLAPASLHFLHPTKQTTVIACLAGRQASRASLESRQCIKAFSPIIVAGLVTLWSEAIY